MAIVIVLILIVAVLGIKHIYDPSFDTIILNEEPTIIMWYNDYDLHGNIVRKYTVLWH